jgi:O-acetyl-ADP-ribose deacetylase (regulator of RNase III)
MVKIIYKTGSLLDATEPVLLHQTNRMGVMGSGIAKIIRERYPMAYEMYHISHKKFGLTLGDNIYVPGIPHTVINACAQATYGTDSSEIYTDYAALAQCFEKASIWIDDENKRRNKPDSLPFISAVAMPRIACARGGGSWKIVEEIIELTCVGFQPVVYTLLGDSSWNT